MATRPVLRLPDPRLSRPAMAVGQVDNTALALATDLLDTMRASPACVGLAAPQVGVSLRAMVADVTGHPKASSCHGPMVLFDPIVVSGEGPVGGREGCMSVPDLTADVVRQTRVVVIGMGIEGQTLEIEADGFEARVLLHELDHLDGVVILDRASPGRVFPRRTYR